MTKLLGLTIVASLAFGGCNKKSGDSACPDVAPEGAKRAGIVLAGAHVCKDDGLVATLEFPDAKPGTVMTSYSQKLVADGYDEQKLDEKIWVFTRGEAEAAFVTSGDASQQRDVPFAVIRYCSTVACVRDTRELAAAFKEAKDKTK